MNEEKHLKEEGEVDDKDNDEVQTVRGNVKRKHSSDSDAEEGNINGFDTVDFRAKNEQDNEPVFFVDVEPSSSRDTAYIKVPEYSVDRDLVRESHENSEKSKKSNKGSQPCCWNCGVDGHSLRDCKVPRNAEIINRNRQAFLDNPKRMMSDFKRYHLEVEVNKYSDLMPGRISQELRDALGLSKRKLPRHIYLMRMLGYPPGWLLEAHVPTSNLEMYDKHGNKVGDADEEEGEIGSVNKNMAFGVNLNSIVKYPGFNVRPSHKTEDEHHLYNAPPMNPKQNINVFIATLRGDINNTTPEQIIENEPEPIVEDMEVVELPDSNFLLPADVCKFVPPFPTEELPPPPDSEPESDNESDSKNEIAGANTSRCEEVPKLTSKPQQFPDLGKVKSVYVGTPVYTQHSPYTKLPTCDMFGKDMPEVVNFENLPKSTGMFRKMNKVLKKVRRAMTENQD